MNILASRYRYLKLTGPGDIISVSRRIDGVIQDTGYAWHGYVLLSQALISWFT